MENGLQQFGRMLIIIGLFTVVAGLIVIAFGRLGFFKLPGDMEFGSKNWKVFFPITTSIVISIILTLIFWLIHYFRK